MLLRFILLILIIEKSMSAAVTINDELKDGKASFHLNIFYIKAIY